MDLQVGQEAQVLEKEGPVVVSELLNLVLSSCGVANLEVPKQIARRVDAELGIHCLFVISNSCVLREENCKFQLLEVAWPAIVVGYGTVFRFFLFVQLSTFECRLELVNKVAQLRVGDTEFVVECVCDVNNMR